MIEAKELRIGNLLDRHTVYEIRENFFTNIMGDSILYRDAKPIPLTGEWLIKLGFKKRDNIYTKKGFKIIGGITIFGAKQNPAFYYKDVRIKSVHQLQNLYYALIGKELTI